jgi:hypothetical protein
MSLARLSAIQQAKQTLVVRVAEVRWQHIGFKGLMVGRLVLSLYLVELVAHVL